MKSDRRVRLRLGGQGRILQSLAYARACRDLRAICSLFAPGRL